MKNKNFIWDLLVRYVILIIVAFSGLSIFYLIFSPLTIYPVYLLLGLFHNVALEGSSIIIKDISIDLIGPCIAGSAYSLLLILNFATSDIKIKKRIKVLLISFSLLLLLNIARIFILSILATKSMFYFNLVHMLFWYILSIVFVVAIWFFMVNKFKIKKIPFYSDLKTLYKLARK